MAIDEAAREALDRMAESFRIQDEANDDFDRRLVEHDDAIGILTRGVTDHNERISSNTDQLNRLEAPVSVSTIVTIIGAAIFFVGGLIFMVWFFNTIETHPVVTTIGKLKVHHQRQSMFSGDVKTVLTFAFAILLAVVGGFFGSLFPGDTKNGADRKAKREARRADRKAKRIDRKAKRKADREAQKAEEEAIRRARELETERTREQTRAGV